MKCPEGEYICSLCWGVHDFYLILALRPSSTICFMRFKDDENPDSLEYVARAHFKDHFVEGSHITLVPNRTHGNLFVYSRDKFMVLDNIGQSTADELKWEITKVIKVPSNIPGMVYDSRDHGLFTIDLDKWSYWKMDERRKNQDYMTIVASSDGNELSRRKGKRGDSEYMSIAVSKSGRFFATGGKDCLCYHEKTRGEYTFEMTTLGCRTHDINYGHVTCIQFNPMELDTRCLATGGDTGNIHIWAIGKKGKVKVTEAKRVKEHEKKYYSRPFGVTDRQVDDVVMDLKMPCVTIKPDDIRVVKEESTTEVAEETSGSSDAIESVDADVVQNIAAVEGSAGVEDVAAVDKSAKTSTSSAPFNTQGQTAADYSSVTLSDELASINEEAAELHRSQTDEMSQHPYRKTFDRLHDVAGKAIHNVMSLGAQADAMLDRIDELTKDDFKEFLKKASTAQRGKL